MVALIGQKVGMTQVFDSEGNVVPVTVIYSGGNYIIDKKDDRIVVSYGNKKINKIKKPILGQFLKAESVRIKNNLKNILSNKELFESYKAILNEQDIVKRESLISENRIDKIVLYAIEFFKIDENSNLDEKITKDAIKEFFEYLRAKQGEDALKAKELGIKNNHIYLPARIIREFKVDNIDKYNIGEYIDVSIFKDVKLVDVTGRSKGRGFAGVFKRWDFKGGPDAHGSKFHRRPGSIGSTTYPGRVIKGKRMPGHYGDEKITIINLKLVNVLEDKGVILVKGAIPGPNGGFVIVRKAKRSN
ncbi:MAG: 50S ribosomal protein L3 [candidate division WOR-3 bacterium]|jgi:large subunit ribosomal protein L3